MLDELHAFETVHENTLLTNKVKQLTEYLPIGAHVADVTKLTENSLVLSVAISPSSVGQPEGSVEISLEINEWRYLFR